MTNGQGRAGRLRVVLEFYRDDQPRLYDELMRFPKGTRRVNRLRFLAQDGLMLAEMRTRGSWQVPVQRLPTATAMETERGDVSVTDVVFDQGDEP